MLYTPEISVYYLSLFPRPTIYMSSEQMLIAHPVLITYLIKVDVCSRSVTLETREQMLIATCEQMLIARPALITYDLLCLLCVCPHTTIFVSSEQMLIARPAFIAYISTGLVTTSFTTSFTTCFTTTYIARPVYALSLVVGVAEIVYVSILTYADECRRMLTYTDVCLQSTPSRS